jgi:hypothetical protein
MKYVQTTVEDELHRKFVWLAYKQGLRVREALRQAIKNYVAEIPDNADLNRFPEVTA